MQRLIGPLRSLLILAIGNLGVFAGLLLIAEVILRFLPVCTGLPIVEVNAESPVFHFLPNQEYLYSRDWDMALVNRGHINNAGFINDQDYRSSGDTPLLAVIGDSYVEAVMVPYVQTFHGRLAKKLSGQLRVYSFAASGAPLSQYLIWARQAVHAYGARALVINVVGNDFDESLAAYNIGPGFWHYVPDEAQGLKLQLFELHSPKLGTIAISTAVGRYLAFNLNAEKIAEKIYFQLFGGPAMAEVRHAGNTWTDTNSVRVNSSIAAINAFFRDLRDMVGLPPDRVLFIMDGMRYPGENAVRKGTYFELMRTTFRSKAESLGYEVTDLDSLFFPRHSRTGERFEFARDNHWNANGHAVAFDAVMQSKLLAGLAGTTKP
jgi:hypothetical protein